MHLRSFIAAAATAFLLAAPAVGSTGLTTKQTKHDRDVIRFFAHHPLLARTPAGVSALWQVIAHLEQTLRSLQSAQAAAIAWPPHHDLWLCVNDNEARGNWRATNGQYRGGLQLHYNWGFGTSYDASADSQLVQEWGAEKAYRNSGYSRQFLVGQWLEWDGAYYCLKYAD